MPPNSTQNLNAKLTLVQGGPHPTGARGPSFSPPPIQSSGPPVRIVGRPASYRGGYHLSL